jgi:Asp-tRNA(Asn)/Glu-tRNA(Gln) amidotransferase A subunit family amidase
VPKVHGGYLAQMSTAGPMARYASDLALLLSVYSFKKLFTFINFF